MFDWLWNKWAKCKELNHTEIKMIKNYENNEDILTNEFVNSLNENIKKEEKPLPLIFDNIEKKTKCR